jgi:predicted ATPase
VLGLEFRNDMLAAVSGWPEPELRGALARLVTAELVVESTAQPGEVYHFRHALLRDAAYKSLLLADRREIHRRIVAALQTRFSDFAESRPEVVAVHASEAGLASFAVVEWQRASEQALARNAHWEALAHITEGMRQLDSLPEGSERFEKELAFELARGPALMAVRGFQAVEVRDTYMRAQELCRKLGDPSRLYPTLWGLWANHFVAGELGPAREYAERVMAIAEASQQPELLVPAYHALGYTLCYQGEYERTLELTRAASAIFDLELERANVRLLQFSSTVALRHFAALALWMLGFPDQAQAESAAAVALAEQLAHPATLAYAQSAVTWGTAFLLGDFRALDEATVKALDVSRSEQFSLWPMLVQAFHGWSLVGSGDVARGLAEMQEGYSAFRRAGGGILRPTLHALMADARFQAGDAAGALEAAAKAIDETSRTQEHNYEPELHRIRGEILASPNAGAARSEADAEAALREALGMARRQKARSLELRAAMSLEAFLSERGRGDEGRAAVRAVYATFTEGFETPDLRRAAVILGEPPRRRGDGPLP